MSILDLDWATVSKTGQLVPQLLPVFDNMLEALAQQGVLDEAALSALRSGALPKDSLNISDAEMGRLFRIGHDFLCASDVRNAAATFEQLCRLDPLEGRYIYALSTTYQIREQFDVAAKLYLMSIAFGLDGPEPYVRLSECLMASNEIPEARDVLDYAIELSKDDPTQSVAGGRARKLRTIISGKAMVN